MRELRGDGSWLCHFAIPGLAPSRTLPYGAACEHRLYAFEFGITREYSQGCSINRQ